MQECVMLRGILICPDLDLNERLESILRDIGVVSIMRTLDHYPNSLELLRFLRAHAPQVIFVSTESTIKALETAREVEKNTPGIQVVAVSRFCDPQILLEVMRAGIREFISLPFDRLALTESLMRVKCALDERPLEIEATDQVFSFLPSKAGVGTSTIALNASIAMSRLPNTNVLLTDFDLNSGMVRFMLKLDNTYCVTDAAEHSLDMDESLWPTMVTTLDRLDVLHAGKLNPDFRVEPTQIRHLMEFMRRNYGALCFDLSGNLERYSLEIMHESKRIFLVCTPEIPSLHLAREKYLYLKQLDLSDRVCVLLNRCQKRPLITPQQIEQLLGLPVHMTFPNDYQGVQRALTFGRWVESNTDLGKQFNLLAQSMLETRQSGLAGDNKKKFIEFFSVVPGKAVVREKSAG
jgi:pilus assembly protein CpaE